MDATVGRFGSRTEAEMARRLLDDAGIPARIRADDAGSLHPELGQVGSHHGITLVVPDEHVAEARRFLEAHAPGAETSTSGSAEGEEPDRSRRGVRSLAVILIVSILGLGLIFNLLEGLTGLG